MTKHTFMRSILLATCILFSFSCLSVLAAERPIPKPGLEKGLEKAEEPATPEPVCPKGTVWSAKEDKCVSDLEAVQDDSGSGAMPGNKLPEEEHGGDFINGAE